MSLPSQGGDLAVAVEGPADICFVKREDTADFSHISLAGVNDNPQLALESGELKGGCECCQKGIDKVS